VCSLQTWPAAFLEIMYGELWAGLSAAFAAKGSHNVSILSAIKFICSARDGYTHFSINERIVQRRCDNERRSTNKLLNFVANVYFLVQQNSITKSKFSFNIKTNLFHTKLYKNRIKVS
jgi:hypothetical protein